MFYADTKIVSIQKPFIGLDMAFNGDKVTTHPTYAGEIVAVTLSYSNNMPTTLTDATISVKFDGAILDKSAVGSIGGFFQSANNTITWDKRTVPGLATLNPGDGGQLQFTFKTLPFVSGSSYTKSSQKVLLSTNVAATKISSNGTVPIASSITRNVVINSNIMVKADAFYKSGPFKNTGLIPPKAEKPTTYTITWSISNSFNNASNVVVSAVLPSNVEFINSVSPQGESLTYNEVSNEVSWNVGNIKTNTGYVSAPRQVSFQVSLLPSLTQVGSSAMLLGDTKLKATDTFTNVSLSALANSLTTDTINDSGYVHGQGTVVK
jgi:hypothetical protein